MHGLRLRPDCSPGGYNTDLAWGPDRYEYYRHAAASEVAPAAIQARAPGRLHAALSGVQAGDFHIDAFSYAADFDVKVLRDDRMIRAGDPDCYRMLLHITGGEVIGQADKEARWTGAGYTDWWCDGGRSALPFPVRPAGRPRSWPLPISFGCPDQLPINSGRILRTNETPQ